MKRAKKILAVLLSMAMMMAMTATAFAEGETTNAERVEVKATGSVLNVEPGSEVTAYRIIKADYDDIGFRGYIVATDQIGAELFGANVPESVSASDLPESTTIPKIATIAQKILDRADGFDKLDTETLTATPAGSTTYQAQLTAGSWVVIIKGKTKVYNPMLLSLSYVDAAAVGDGSLSNGSVDSELKVALGGTEVYAKSSDAPPIDKTIANTNGNEHGSSAGFEDTVNYVISTNIPPYSSGYKNVVVKIHDKLSEGLTFVDDSIKVKVGDQEDVRPTADGKTNYTILPNDENGKYTFTISFDSEYALKNQGKAVEVRYSAKLDKDKVATNFNPNTNTATLEYSNDPSDSASTNKVDRENYVYTFEIGANIFGQTDGRTDIIQKTGEEVTEDGKKAPLPGAEFVLKQGTTTVSSCITGADGLLKFKGLKEGEYTLVETKAPNGYSLSDKTYHVKIDATYFDNGRLKEYKIWIDDKEIQENENPEYTFTADKDTDAPTITGDENITPIDIPNTKLSSLPSTGGIGTTIFTVVGCIVMIAAAGLFFASRRKKSA